MINQIRFFKASQSKSQLNKVILKAGLLSLSLILGFISCSQKIESKRSQLLSAKAPTSQSEAGFIVNGVSENEMNNFLSSTGLEARVLHQKTGMYEVFSQDELLLEQAFPQAEIVPNVYFDNLFIDTLSPRVLLERKLTLLNEVENGNASDQDPKKCKRNPLTGPSPKLENIVKEGLDKIVSNGTIELSGKTVAFSAKNSLRAPDGSVFLWQVIAPNGSDVNQEIQTAKEINFTPDMPGAYMVALLIIDSENNCNLAQSVFAITTNLDKTAAIAPRDLTDEDRENFHHLSLVNVEESWVFSQGEGVKIAVIDTGMNYNHPDLSQNVAVNEKEIPGNGIDDDENGYVDDVYGWDFVNNDNRPFDDQGHGTHVSGLSASAVTGVAPRAKVIPVKALSAFGSGDTASISAAIKYAVDVGADVINMSLGGADPTFEIGLMSAMKYAEDKGVIVMAAAGNGHPVFGIPMDNDKSPVFPASMKNKNIITVAATDKMHVLTEYSNFGKTSVHIAAPGGSSRKGDKGLLASNYWPVEGKNNQYVAYSGTSMATPVSAGAVALLKSMDQSLDADGLKNIFYMTSQKQNVLQGKVVSEGVIDVLSAVAYVTYAETINGGDFPPRAMDGEAVLE